VLVIPIQHLGGPAEIDSPEGEEIVGKTMRFAVKVARELGLESEGYRIVTNQGKNGGQSVFHLHLHILGGRRMSWPPLFLTEVQIVIN